MINETLELEFPIEYLKRVVLFNCKWYNPTSPGGTYKYNAYKIIKINHTKIYKNFNPFIIA